VLEGALITSMLKEQASTFANMEGYAKMLLIKGWLDDQARVNTKEGELNLI
jgi:hypothetical protein